MRSDMTHRCAILTPSGVEFQRVAEALTDALAGFYARVAWVTGIDSNDPMVDADGYSRVSTIQLQLRAATHVIVDITGYNPNIMYELGVAHASRKPTLIIARDAASSEHSTRLPAPLEGFLVFIYDPNDLALLLRYARTWTLDHLTVPERAVAHGG